MPQPKLPTPLPVGDEAGARQVACALLQAVDERPAGRPLKTGVGVEQYRLQLEPGVQVPFTAQPQCQLEQLAFTMTVTNVDAALYNNNKIVFEWDPFIPDRKSTPTPDAMRYSQVTTDLVTTREISAVDLLYSRRRPHESAPNWIAVGMGPTPDLMRHYVASRGGTKCGTTRDDSRGWGAIPVAISLAESWWRGAIPVAISLAESWSRRGRE
eukprot:COSAG02_NODE_1554_length_11948_cov_41.539455_6_plen_212_part_00